MKSSENDLIILSIDRTQMTLIELIFADLSEIIS